jgi:hypothetical protein
MNDGISGGCMYGDGIVVCSPRGYSYRAILRCPTCKARRRFVVTLHMWYGPDQVCCGCGESWSDGEMSPRPFQRGWRVESIKRAKKWWALAVTRGEANAALMAEVSKYMEPSQPAGGGVRD